MIVSVHQPQYLPWLGYFHKIAQSDCFVFLDRVQYKPREFQNRNRIRTKDGWIWLTVPVVSDAEKGRQVINEVKVDNSSPWQRKHEASLATWYGSAPFFNEYFPFFKEALAKDWHGLSELNVHIIRHVLDVLSISTPTRFESELNIPGTSTQRIIEICKTLGADTYLSGAGGRDYLDEPLFAQNGIKLVYQDFKHPEYKQRYEPFVPLMSIVDLLFNCGQSSVDLFRR